MDTYELADVSTALLAEAAAQSAHRAARTLTGGSGHALRQTAIALLEGSSLSDHANPGEATLPTSEFVCATGGMIVICAGTTGYNVTLDLRYHWMRQKRFQGSHLSNDQQALAVTKLVDAGKVDPCLSQTYRFDELPECHQLMLDNKHPYGNMAVLVNAPKTGLGAS